MIPHRTPFFLPWIYPKLTWRMPTEEKELYLTFDDGPVHGPTEFVLETLRQHAAKATFFCIGDNVKKHPGVFKKIVDDGHAIGNHTFNHLNGWKTAGPSYFENVKQCDEVFQQNAVQSKLFRPPYGRITAKQIKGLSDYTIVMWDVLSVDYLKSLSAEACLQNTIRATRPGSIIVFHDSYKAEKNMTHALPRFVEHFMDKGFSFKVLQ
jgi:peptidoglycan/xylan/chitin deacetylase (PgdA/CDA1 family)